MDQPVVAAHLLLLLRHPGAEKFSFETLTNRKLRDKSSDLLTGAEKQPTVLYLT
jgi:hypothetical protein